MTDRPQGLKSGLTRRRLLRNASSALPLMLASATSSIPLGRALAAEKGPINFLTWGGNFGKGIRTAFSDPFTKATGITVTDITPFSYGKFQTAMRNGNPEGYDLAWFNDEVQPILAGKAGMLEKLNYDWIPNAKGAVPATRQEFGAAPYITLYQLAYKSDSYGDKPPANWADFWNVQAFPGPRSFGTWVCGVLEAALMADGVSPKDIYPLDEARAFKSLDKIKPHIRVFHDTQSSANVPQMLEQGEITMVLTWSTDSVAAHLAGKPVNVVYNQGFYFSPLVGIAKGTKYLKEAHEYLNLFFDPQDELAFIRAWPTSPANSSVLSLLTDKEKASVAISHLDEMVHMNSGYYAENEERLQQKYDSWRVG
jgi:putative spermidine/putrescine transport system substrate-binding protein